MTTFIAKAQRALGQDVPVAADYFADDDGDTHEDNIDAITAEGITQGAGTNAQGQNRYDPVTSVRRD
jgi:hypothetical protein